MVLGLGLLLAAPNAWAGVGINNGVLTYTARAGDQNRIGVNTVDAEYLVVDSVPIDSDASGGCTVSGNAAHCPSALVSSIEIDAGDGDDIVTIDPEITKPATLNGGPGSDVIAGGGGNDTLAGGEGQDTVDYSGPWPVDGGVNVSFPSGTASGVAGTDTLSGFESLTGSPGNDQLDVRDNTRGDVSCNDGEDTVSADPSDIIALDCEHIKIDNHQPPVTAIDSGPPEFSGADTVVFTFLSNEPGTFECQLTGLALEPGCTSPKSYGPLVEGDYTFEVTAIDDFGNRGNTVAYQFTIDKTPPDTAIGTPANDGETFNTSTPIFEFSSPDPQATFECTIDQTVYQSCQSSVPFPVPIANGDHTLTVAAKDRAGNIDQTPATRSFRIDAPAVVPGPGGPPATQQQASSSNVVVFGSLVLISGRSVKLVKGRLVPVTLTCSGQRKCDGRLTITSDKPLRKSSKGKRKKKKSKRVERLGSKRFSIEGNRHAKVLVPLSRSKVRLLKRLRQIKVRATIREVDIHGNPRISTRTFLLRAR